MNKSHQKTRNLKPCLRRQVETRNLRIALVYDKINTWGGAERVLLALHEIFPDAPLYTSVYNHDKAKWAQIFPQIIPSFLQKFPFSQTHNHWYTPLMPLAFENLNFDKFDVVISITSGEAKSIITKPHTLHLCYCLTPTRYLWVDPGYKSYKNFGILNSLIHSIKAPLLHYLRLWDQIAAARPDSYSTISQTVQNRIAKYYHRDSKIIYPPVDTNFFQATTGLPAQAGNKQLTTDKYFLVVSRLVPYKRVDLAIQACQQLNLNLKIAGTGPDYHRLTQLLNYPITQLPNVEFLGSVTDTQLRDLYQNCQALIMPQTEDFGITALEAQACGKPVIAYRHGGGVTETVIENKTGLFFDQQTPESLVKTMKQFNNETMKQFTIEACRNQALRFSLDNFRAHLKQWVAQSLAFHYYRL